MRIEKATATVWLLLRAVGSLFYIIPYLMNFVNTVLQIRKPPDQGLRPVSGGFMWKGDLYNHSAASSALATISTTASIPSSQVMVHPAALICPPPPKEAQMADTSTWQEERMETR